MPRRSWGTTGRNLYRGTRRQGSVGSSRWCPDRRCWRWWHVSRRSDECRCARICFSAACTGLDHVEYLRAWWPSGSWWRRLSSYYPWSWWGFVGGFPTMWAEVTSRPSGSRWPSWCCHQLRLLCPGSRSWDILREGSWWHTCWSLLVWSCMDRCASWSDMRMPKIGRCWWSLITTLTTNISVNQVAINIFVRIICFKLINSTSLGGMRCFAGLCSEYARNKH